MDPQGATLSDVTAEAEYGVSRDFIVKGIEAAKLEFRPGAIWGNPYLRILRADSKVHRGGTWRGLFGESQESDRAAQDQEEITDLKKQLTALQERKAALEESLK